MALGTWIAIEATAESAETALQALESGFAAVHEVDRLMHPRRQGSDLAAIHTAAPGTPIAIHRSTCEVLSLAKVIHRLSDGVFDPCVTPLRDGRQRAGSLADLEIVEGETGAARAVVCRAALSLDLGGIAKGYAVDRAVIALRAAGCCSGLVNAGGDLRVFGTNAQTLFLRKGSQTHRVELAEAALAVSDADAAQRPVEHRGYYIGSSTDPQLVCRYAAVLAPEAAIADALTKCVLLCPPETTARALRELRARQIAFERVRS